jgi:predicted rRNA methylase YqxC with S4 and FtsJ domains
LLHSSDGERLSDRNPPRRFDGRGQIKMQTKIEPFHLLGPPNDNVTRNLNASKGGFEDVLIDQGNPETLGRSAQEEIQKIFHTLDRKTRG